jgi:hypothetical protein
MTMPDSPGPPPRRYTRIGLFAVAALGALAGVALFAAVGAALSNQAKPSAAKPTFLAVCIQKTGGAESVGDLNVLLKSKFCGKVLPTKLALYPATQGPQGPPGPKGATGPAGAKGPAGPPGQNAPPSLDTTAGRYAQGATVTYTGAGWSGCTKIKIDAIGPGGFTVATGVTPRSGGAIHGTFTAPSAGGGDLLLIAESQGGPPGCRAFTAFTVL